ncbi:MAG TPA: bifunctional riboflavin kinase/FAD synthetase [Polyangiaceae bacterium]|nr:bifunctional riboflavin kinase/FAD synthetase [Polyangiaceae bacterium]
MVQPLRIDGARAWKASGTGSLVAIGNFDGVHAGHRAVLGAASAEAHEKGLAFLVLTFDPHPTVVLGRGRQAVLTPLDRKVELLGAPDPSLRVVVEPFTPELAQMTPRAFAEELLVGHLGAKVVVVGENFRFGHARAGDLPFLVRLGTELGFTARAEELLSDGEGPISSSRIRAAIAARDLACAERLLGRPHALTGVVVKGDGRGRTIQVPTANLSGVEEALPPYGVYAVLVDDVGEDETTRLGTGVLNVGNRPTVSAGFSVEVHLHDFDGDLYGKRLRLHLVQAIREEKKFSSLDELVVQIRRDIETAREATRRRAPPKGPRGGWY